MRKLKERNTVLLCANMLGIEKENCYQLGSDISPVTLKTFNDFSIIVLIAERGRHLKYFPIVYANGTQIHRRKKKNNIIT